jgi:hypothetical protein
MGNRIVAIGPLPSTSVRRHVAVLGWALVVRLVLVCLVFRECLDHCLILNEAHLRRLLRGYIAYYNYNTARGHTNRSTTTVPSHETWNPRHVAGSSLLRRLAGSIIAISGSPDRRRAPGQPRPSA